MRAGLRKGFSVILIGCFGPNTDWPTLWVHEALATLPCANTASCLRGSWRETICLCSAASPCHKSNPLEHVGERAAAMRCLGQSCCHSCKTAQSADFGPFPRHVEAPDLRNWQSFTLLLHHIDIDLHLHTYIHIRTHTCTYKYITIYICILIYICISIHIYVCAYVHLYIHLYMYTYCTYTYSHIRIDIYKLAHIGKTYP